MPERKERKKMKLTATQQNEMNKAKEKIDFARAHTLREWAEKRTGLTKEGREMRIETAVKYGESREKYEQYFEDELKEYEERYFESYEDERNAIVLTRANTKTLKKLEELGLIEIINIGGTWIDSIKILNY
jgi:hypothetical protein